MSSIDQHEQLMTALFQRPWPEVRRLLARDRGGRPGRRKAEEILALIANHRRDNGPEEVLARTDLTRALERLAQLPLDEIRAACLQRTEGQALMAALDVLLALHACRGVWRAQRVPMALLAGGIWFKICGMPLPTPAQAATLLVLRRHLRSGYRLTFRLLRSLSRQAKKLRGRDARGCLPSSAGPP